jgi:hypothetical protein
VRSMSCTMYACLISNDCSTNCCLLTLPFIQVLWRTWFPFCINIIMLWVPSASFIVYHSFIQICLKLTIAAMVTPRGWPGIHVESLELVGYYPFVVNRNCAWVLSDCNTAIIICFLVSLWSWYDSVSSQCLIFSNAVMLHWITLILYIALL